METILNNIATSEIGKKLTKNVNNMYEVSDFLRDANKYIQAIKEGRMLCVIPSVSKSGMSRTIKFSSCEKHAGIFGDENKHSYRNYWALFKALGYKESRNKDGFTISGCGMDMIFHTNYTNMHTFKNLGIITKEECEKLCQMTPTVL